MSGHRTGSRRGVTLIEVLIAVTLLSLLTVGMLFSLRIGLNTFGKTGDKLMEDRRIAGAQRILFQQIEGMAPVIAPCGGQDGKAGPPFVFFQGEARTLRFISTFSLHEGWRGHNQILEFTVIPGENGEGVRLIVNETPYSGPLNAGKSCVAMAPDPETGAPHPKFTPVEASPQSFVLADKLAYCRFVYLTRPLTPLLPSVWKPAWTQSGWPLGIRVEMAPLAPDPTRLRPITVTAPIYLHRSPEITYDNL
jgi:prepilin-type N-terminal cleavage/methylation domain-containing protein